MIVASQLHGQLGIAGVEPVAGKDFYDFRSRTGGDEVGQSRAVRGNDGRGAGDKSHLLREGNLLEMNDGESALGEFLLDFRFVRQRPVGAERSGNVELGRRFAAARNPREKGAAERSQIDGGDESSVDPERGEYEVLDENNLTGRQALLFRNAEKVENAIDEPGMVRGEKDFRRRNELQCMEDIRQHIEQDVVVAEGREDDHGARFRQRNRMLHRGRNPFLEQAREGAGAFLENGAAGKPGQPRPRDHDDIAKPVDEFGVEGGLAREFRREVIREGIGLDTRRCDFPAVGDMVAHGWVRTPLHQCPAKVRAQRASAERTERNPFREPIQIVAEDRQFHAANPITEWKSEANAP